MEYKSSEVGLIPKHWEVVSLGEIGEIIGGGTPSTKKEEYYGGAIPWITPKDLSGYTKQRISKGKRNITEVGLKNSSARLLPKNTVLLSSRAPIGYVVIADKELSTNQGFKSIICNEDKVIPEFLYYLLKKSKEALEAISSGSTFKEISGTTVKSFKIGLPPLKEQKSIIKILTSLDDKIELNADVTANLEELSQAIFKQWFIDFEFPNENGKPYKSYEGEMAESEVGLIPLNWSIGTLNDLGEIVGGGTPSKKIAEYYIQDGISWITPKDLSKDKSVYIYRGAIDITEEALRKSSTKILPKYSVLFSSRAPIGYVAIAGGNVATNQGFKSIVPAERIPSEYVFFLLKHLTPIIEANAGGSTFKEISGSGMKGIKTVLPPSALLLKYKETVESLFEKIRLVEKENKVLVDLHKALLPKLLSGEIELPDETEVIEHVPIP